MFKFVGAAQTKLVNLFSGENFSALEVATRGFLFSVAALQWCA